MYSGREMQGFRSGLSSENTQAQSHTGHDGKRERATEEGEGEKDRKGRLVLEDSHDHD